MSNFLIANVENNDYLVTTEKTFINTLHFGSFNVDDFKHIAFDPHVFINEDEYEIYCIDLTSEIELSKLLNFDKSDKSYTQMKELIDDINYIRLHTAKYVIFQNITKRNIVRKSFIAEAFMGKTKNGNLDKGRQYTLSSDGQKILVISDKFDFIYEKKSQKIYFHKISNIINIFPAFSKFFRDVAEEDLIKLKNFKLIDFDYKPIPYEDGTKDFNLISGSHSVGLIGKLNLKNVVNFSDNIKKFEKLSIKKLQEIISDFELDLKVINKKVQIIKNKDLTSFFKVLFSRFHIDLLTDDKMENKGARALKK